ncbi:cell division protein FtsL [Ectobacillus sp. sgz5001026]|uniref:cell division protein FtsL n=1 Tax=Ectobacillus sp. sgz5001026 TaxID=3242473 RepID=UPI0036D2227A
MTNVAVKYRKKQSQVEMQQPVAQPVHKAKVTLIEKILYTAFIVFLLYAAVVIIGNKAQMFQSNAKTVDLRNDIEKQKKVNNDLKADVEKLSSYDRIAEKAKSMGLSINENNVKSLRP